MKQRLLTWWVGILAAVAPATASFARIVVEEPDRLDARLEGYATNVTLKPGGVGPYWVLLVILAMICMSVVFKNAKRTHLD